MQNITIVDTTLRDGEQAAGIVFSTAEKIVIAKMLDQAGVQQIEVGVPAMGIEEQKVIRAIAELNLNAKLSTWNRIKLSDIKASLECGIKFVHISAPVSDILIEYKLGKSRDWVLEKTKLAICYAKEQGCTISIGAEDASRADESFLLKFTELIQGEGVKQMRYADTLGVLDYFSTYERINKLVNETDLAIEFHGHNDFGMVIANTVAAVKAGAKLISTTVNGIGERAGNAPMEEVIIALKEFLNNDN